MSRYPRYALAAIAALGLFIGFTPAEAKPRNEREQTAAEREKSKKEFRSEEREIIERYFKANPSAAKRLPPGLAKKNKLPPGWQKKMARGEVVPDDVWRHRVQLPQDVVRKLPPNPPGTVIVRVDDKVVRVIENTREILDIFGLPSF